LEQVMTTIYREVEVDVDMDDFEDNDLIVEIERRGYTVLYGELTRSIERLRSSYLTSSKEFFDKELREFFKETDMPV
jgi:hypothetical protein